MYGVMKKIRSRNRVDRSTSVHFKIYEVRGCNEKNSVESNGGWKKEGWSLKPNLNLEDSLEDGRKERRRLTEGGVAIGTSPRSPISSSFVVHRGDTLGQRIVSVAAS